MPDKEIILGSIGWSPDFVSKPENILELIAKGKVKVAPRFANGRMASADLVEVSAPDPALEDEIDRLRDLIWKNRHCIDFTGFEDIADQIHRAENG